MFGAVAAIVGSLIVVLSGFLTHRIYSEQMRIIVRILLMAGGTVLALYGILSFPLIR